MTPRRALLLPLALAPLAGWAVWRAGEAEPDGAAAGAYAVGVGAGAGAGQGHAGAAGALHLGDDPMAALWRRLMSVTRDAAPMAPARFHPDVTALDGAEITLRGFMVALSDGGAQRRFLFAPNPPGCPGCQPLNWSSLLDARGARPLVPAADPVTLTGVLRLRRHEELVYRLDGATPVAG